MTCLIMSCPIFSQIVTDTNNLISIPSIHAKSVVAELIEYDFIKIERDTLLKQNLDYQKIIEQDSILLVRYENVTDSLTLINENLLNEYMKVSLDNESKNNKIKTLRNTRNLTILTTVLTAVLPAVLNKNE